MKYLSMLSWPTRRVPIGTIMALATPASTGSRPDFSVKAQTTAKPTA